MAAVVNRYGAGWILMHAGPDGAATADETDYPGGVAAHVQAFFDGALTAAEALGVARERICLDPGFGFAKTEAQNLELQVRLYRILLKGLID